MASAVISVTCIATGSVTVPTAVPVSVNTSNLLFTSGQQMDRIFGALIDWVRGPLDLRTVKTVFGRRQRSRRHKGQPRAPVVEVSFETPEYDLTILRIRFRRLTLKIYTKGERVLRIEAMAHNARDLGCRLGAWYFPEAVKVLRQMVERFIEVLDCLDATFIDAGLLDRLPRPGRLGAVRVGGIDRPRARGFMQALLALSPNPAGFTSSELATKVARLLNDERYSPSRAAYDLRKFRCKGLAAMKPRSRRYRADPTALRAMAAILLLRDKVVSPLLAAASTPRTISALDQRYAAVHHEMRSLFNTLGIAA